MTETVAWRRSVLISLGLLILTSALLALLAVRWYNHNLQAVGPESSPSVEFAVSPPADLDQIASDLQAAGLIRSQTAFRLYVQLRSYDHRFSQGRFRLDAGMSVAELVSRLISPPDQGISITILPGQNLQELVDSLERQGFSRQVAKQAIDIDRWRDRPLVSQIPEGGSLEGYIFPETFFVSDFSLASAERLIGLSLAELEHQLTASRLAALERQGLNPHQALTVASIVELEVPGDQDRRSVAQVFLSRLQAGMRLGSDITFFYASEITGQPAHPGLDHPYNTRLYAGLPPGPVSNVSQSSLLAVIDPAPTEYLYFLTGDDGRTYFNRTLEGHNQDRRDHCRQLCQLPGG